MSDLNPQTALLRFKWRRLIESASVRLQVCEFHPAESLPRFLQRTKTSRNTNTKILRRNRRYLLFVSEC